MVLCVDYDTVYPVLPEDLSCYAGHFYLSAWPSTEPVNISTKQNGPIHIEWKTIHNVVSSASDDETCGASNNEKQLSECNQILSRYNTNKQ